MADLADVSREELAMYFEFLDQLRESGAINMFGAAPCLSEEYDIPRKKAIVVLTKWMGTDLSVPAEVRAEKVLAGAAA